MRRVARPVLVYDGECAFCRRWVERWRRTTKDRIEFAPYQHLGHRFAQIPRSDFRGSVHLIEPKRTSTGARAVFRMLSIAGRRWLDRLYRWMPGFASVAERVYRFVAGHRTLMGTVERWSFGAPSRPPALVLTRSLFLRALGIVYLCAFLSLWVQIKGLIGERGVLPIHSGAALERACLAGALLSTLIACGFVGAPLLIGVWTIYLSLTRAGDRFLSYQWDALLLESGLLAVLYAPLSPRPSLERLGPPPRSVHWLLRWLLFRLLFTSGMVKLSSGDPTWRNGTALFHHHQTQPLASPISWHLRQLPPWFHRALTRSVLTAELAVPFLYLGPRRLRIAGFAANTIFQVAIAATGNFGFFNLLTIVLGIPLLDDAVLSRREIPASPRLARSFPTWISTPLILPLFAVSASDLVRACRKGRVRAMRLGPVRRLASALRCANTYGLFAVMTTRRLEIVLEGSNDGESWRAYELRWKAGDVMRRPRWTGVHMPRLDWQLWFAALGGFWSNVWVVGLMAKLLEGSPDVLTLFAKNPFPDAPPRYVRALLYEYRFTDRATHRATGAWWERELIGLYAPVLTVSSTDR